MIRERNIRWFLEEPTRLMQMKPFTRGGSMNRHGYETGTVLNNTMIETGFADLSLKPISQDLYITEYRPDLHHIILNKAIPHIKVVLDGQELTNMLQLTQTASFQKLIHSAHVRNLTANNLEFSLCNETPDDAERKVFGEIKQEWIWREREWNKYMAINTCKQLGNCGVLFGFDRETGMYTVTNYSYEDGYQIVPNYDEYGIEIARSLVYQVDETIVIDTFDSTKHYRCTKSNDGKWEITSEKHGYSRCPLLHKRGKVAWEYAESSIEMWELMTNINAIALKRFGTFALAFWGEMDKDKGLQRDSSTLIVNLSSDTTNGRQDVKVLEFPEPQTMDGYLKTLEEKISLFSSTSFITPKDITTSNSGGNGIALAMSNDYSLAVQSSLDWQRFVNDMVYLHQEGLDLENNGTSKYSSIRIGAKIIPWSLETNNTKLLNLMMEAPYLSTQTVLEKCPDGAPDELTRVIEERGGLFTRDQVSALESADKANAIQRNRNDIIRDNEDKMVVEVQEMNN